jgi:hypothetical protein
MLNFQEYFVYQNQNQNLINYVTDMCRLPRYYGIILFKWIYKKKLGGII